MRNLNARGMHVAMDLLGEYVDDRRVAESARDAYVDLVSTIARERNANGFDANVSIKLSMLGQKIDEDFCLENLRALLDVARRQDVFIRLDMEGSDITESTIRLFEEVYPDYPDHVGIVLQAYLKRTAKDVDRMCELRARVRICKGAYKEPPSIAHQKMPVIRDRYLAYAKQLIRHSWYPGIATHDDQLIQAVKEFVDREEIPRDRYEFQMLYGIRPAAQEAIARQGYNIRIYLPFGRDWLPYFSRRLRERKENLWFVVRNLFRG